MTNKNARVDTKRVSTSVRRVALIQAGTDARHAARRTAFIRKLAEYLAGNQAEQSIRLSMGDEKAKLWSEIRSTTPLFGYPTIDEAEVQLTEWFERGMT